MLARIRDHRDGLLVVLRQNSHHIGPSAGTELHALPNSEIEHGAVRSHLAQEFETRHNFVVQGNQIFFGEGIDIEVGHGSYFPRLHAHFASGCLKSATS